MTEVFWGSFEKWSALIASLLEPYMKIQKVVCSAGKTGFFFDDQKAIKAGAKSDGNFYEGKPVIPGFSSVRQMGESISVMFVLEDGQVIEQGTHAELMKKQGKYYELFATQAKRYFTSQE